MEIGGFQKFSLIDYPGGICATIFARGCNFRCPYCHNPELVYPDLYNPCIPEEEVWAFLDKRRGKLDAVTLTGGEPTLQSDLAEAIRRIRARGFRVKLDTNGSRPEVLQHLIDENLLDYIAMDVKGPLEKYASLSGSTRAASAIPASIEAIKASGIEYEFRTTVLKSLLSREDILQIGRLIGKAHRYVLQRFKPAGNLRESFPSDENFMSADLESLQKMLAKNILYVKVR
ncbi:MAG: anaerobic ribonucleoside-triphosphate reductase activating protein [Deltaproteobacteria bacterium]|nr:anaerobic ribonucleoside-triphosphate reductase activating protein [Deltaproteobacteria bacterium]